MAKNSGDTSQIVTPYDLPEWLWPKMTEEDQMEWRCLYLSGNMVYHPDGSVTIMAGKWKFDKMNEMRKVLIDKYKEL